MKYYTPTIYARGHTDIRMFTLESLQKYKKVYLKIHAYNNGNAFVETSWRCDVNSVKAYMTYSYVMCASSTLFVPIPPELFSLSVTEYNVSLSDSESKCFSGTAGASLSEPEFVSLLDFA